MAEFTNIIELNQWSKNNADAYTDEPEYNHQLDDKGTSINKTMSDRVGIFIKVLVSLVSQSH